MTLLFIRIFHFVISYNSLHFYRRVRRHLNAMWIGCELKQFGEHNTIGRNLYLAGGRYIEIGNYTFIDNNCVLTAWDKYENDSFNPCITIGNNCSFGEYNHITAINKIAIGNNVLTGRWITITDHAHGRTFLEELKTPPAKRKLYSKGEVIIEDNVWIGDKATILPNIHIGRGAIIAANAVVSHDVPAYAIVAGNPAKILNKLNY